MSFYSSLSQNGNKWFYNGNHKNDACFQLFNSPFFKLRNISIFKGASLNLLSDKILYYLYTFIFQPISHLFIYQNLVCMVSQTTLAAILVAFWQ